MNTHHNYQSAMQTNHTTTETPSKPSILDFNRDELEIEITKTLGQSAYRAKQIWHAIHRECTDNFQAITTLPTSLRQTLEEKYIANPLQLVKHLTSADGSTDKALFRLHDGELIETVLMRYPEDSHRKSRKTVCISTQAGCALGCTFCATGQQGFRRQLSSGEIVAQAIRMQRIALDEDIAEVVAGARDNGSVQGITNIVLMGMGEPLANYQNSINAIRVMNNPHGLAIGARHITLSTVGLVPQILQLAKENLQINLAVSLHAPDDNTRSETMPINRRYPLNQLISACRDYVQITNRRIFFEYVLLKNQNDSVSHAQKLGKLLNGLLCHVNLIPVNPTSQGTYQRTDTTQSAAFQTELRNFGIPSTIRMEKGIDINAGCGQLRERVLELDAISHNTQ